MLRCHEKEEYRKHKLFYQSDIWKDPENTCFVEETPRLSGVNCFGYYTRLIEPRKRSGYKQTAVPVMAASSPFKTLQPICSRLKKDGVLEDFSLRIYLSTTKSSKFEVASLGPAADLQLSISTEAWRTARSPS